MQLFSEFSFFGMLLAAVIGYFLGNIQTAIIISKLAFHDDVRKHGSGNAGSTNMVRVFGLKPGLLTFAGDFLKAAIGVLVGRLLCGQLGGYIGGLFVVAGHCWPVLDGFRGGKGVASSFGVAWLCFPLGALITTGVIIVTFLVSKRVSIMSLVGMITFLLTTILFKQNPLLICLAAALLAIVYIRHIDNIKRIVTGREGKFIN